MSKTLLLIFSFSLIALTFPKTAEAKLLPQARGSGATIRTGPTTGITVTPKLRSDRKAIVVNFGNLQNANSVTYTLIYQSGGQEQGAGGTLSASGTSASRTLLFGTCSGSVCNYHTNITNMRLEIVSQLKSGKKTLKRYRIRV